MCSSDLYKAMALTFVICVLYAITDEYHQTFVAGRSGELRDVVIDSLGALLGILIYYVIMIIGENYNKGLAFIHGKVVKKQGK